MTPIEKVKSALRRLHVSDLQQTVYLSLLTEGRATARVLSARTGITRPSVYDQIKSLRTRGLIVELDIDNKAHFAAAELKQLDALLSDQIDRIEQSRDFLREALPSLMESLETVSPKVRFFEGAEGLKQLLKDIMWHDRTTLQIIWPTKEIERVFDVKFLAWFDERRQKRSLKVELLYPAKQPPSYFAGKHDILKPLPNGANVAMTSILFDAKVAFISSAVESFGFIVESKEFVALQKLQFHALWESAS